MPYQFTKDDSSRGGKKAAIVLQQRTNDKRRKSVAVHRFVDEIEDLSPALLEASLGIAEKILESAHLVPILTWLDAQRAATTAEILHRISRLASGQSTNNNLTLTITDEERKERMAYLRQLMEGVGKDKSEDIVDVKPKGKSDTPSVHSINDTPPIDINNKERG